MFAEACKRTTQPAARTPAPATRSCSCARSAGQRECPECRKKRRTEQSSATAASGPPPGHRFGSVTVYPGYREGKTQTLAPAEGNPTRTQELGPVGPVAPPSNGCSVTGSFSSIPSGTLVPTWSGGFLTAPFNMVGDFVPQIPCTCQCGEYRQHVRGTFKVNGAVHTHPLCGTNLHPTTFQEDCARVGGVDHRYGYRSHAFATSKFTPDQMTGCTFEGFDSPGISGTTGETLSINLDFTGKLIDTCNGDRVLASAAWSVVGSTTVP